MRASDSPEIRDHDPFYPFVLQDFYDHPEKYEPVFGSYVPHLTILVNCIFWSPKYPKYVTKEYLKKLYGGPAAPRVRVVGDITCDIDGSMECTIKATEPDVPSFVYDPFQDVARDGFAGNGPVVMAVDNQTRVSRAREELAAIQHKKRVMVESLFTKGKAFILLAGPVAVLLIPALMLTSRLFRRIELPKGKPWKRGI